MRGIMSAMNIAGQTETDMTAAQHDAEEHPSGVFPVTSSRLFPPIEFQKPDAFGEFASRLLEVGLHSLMVKISVTYHVALVDVYEGPRTKNTIRARRACWLHLKQQCGFSDAEVARLFDRNPSTITRASLPQSRKKKVV